MNEAIRPTSHYYRSQRLRLHYVDWGNPDAPPLLLIHGGRDHCRNWDWVARRLANRYHVIAPDLRGHGDSQWITGGTYNMADYVYDIAQLVHQLELAPLQIVAHSMGGNIALRYTGVYPENVERIVAIEGLGMSPRFLKQYASVSVNQRMSNWVEQLRELSGRQTRRYSTLDEAVERMLAANPHLTDDQARHLTVHGSNRNEDGSYSWKFDNYMHAYPGSGLDQDAAQSLFARITCPALLMYGAESDASNPTYDGRAEVFNNARIETVKEAGHWVHHDQIDVFMGLLEEFLSP